VVVHRFSSRLSSDTDTADKINYVKMEKILKLAYLTGFDFGDAKNPPKFIARPAQ